MSLIIFVFILALYTLYIFTDYNFPAQLPVAVAWAAGLVICACIFYFGRKKSPIKTAYALFGLAALLMIPAFFTFPSPLDYVQLSGVTLVQFTFFVALYYGSVAFCEAMDDNSVMKVYYGCLFAVYALYLFYLLFIGMGRVGFDKNVITDPEYLSRYIRYYTNFVPFKTVTQYISGKFTGSIIVNVVGNTAAFMPFAFLMTRISDKMKKPWVFILTLSLTVIAVELTQLFFYTGACDIDDFILNVGGALVVYLGIKILDRRVTQIYT